MKVLLVFLALIVGVMLAAIYSSHEEEEWGSFKVKFERVYENDGEEDRRKVIFVDNLRRIEEHNKLYEQGKVTFTQGVNQFADKLPGEIPTGLKIPKQNH